MQSLPAALAAHIATRSTSLAAALKVTRTDGQVYAFTTHDISDSINGVTYEGQPGLFLTELVITAGAQVGNLELTTLHDESIFTTADIMNGRWRNAAFQIFRYNWNAVGLGSPSGTDIHTLLAGTMGEVRLLKNTIVAELRDLRQTLQQEVGDASSQTCRRRLGSTGQIGGNCRVRIEPPTWAAATPATVRPVGDAALGSVVKPTVLNDRHFRCTTAGTTGGSEPTWNTTIGGTTNDNGVVWTTIMALKVAGTLTHVTSNQVFRDSSLDAPADWFGEGEFTITSGDNAGASFKIKEYAADGTFTLSTPIYGEVEVGNTFTAEAGCRKRHEEDCWDKFDNGLNGVSEPHRRGTNNLTSAPTSDVSAIEQALDQTFEL